MLYTEVEFASLEEAEKKWRYRGILTQRGSEKGAFRQRSLQNLPTRSCRWGRSPAGTVKIYHLFVRLEQTSRPTFHDLDSLRWEKFLLIKWKLTIQKEKHNGLVKQERNSMTSTKNQNETWCVESPSRPRSHSKSVLVVRRWIEVKLRRCDVATSYATLHIKMFQCTYYVVRAATCFKLNRLAWQKVLMWVIMILVFTW